MRHVLNRADLVVKINSLSETSRCAEIIRSHENKN